LLKSDVPEKYIYTVHNSVDSARFTEANKNRDKLRDTLLPSANMLAIGIFGRVAEWKGQEDFIKAIKILSNNTQTKFKAFIVGDGSDSDAAYYENLKYCYETDVSNGLLEFCGYISDVEEYYSAMDIVVHASIRPEPFGRVVIEGMAARSALIAMNEGGPAEVITNGIDGLLVEPRSLEKLVEALIAVCESNDLRVKLSENGLKTVRTKYTPEYVGGEIEKQLLQVIDNFSKE